MIKIDVFSNTSVDFECDVFDFHSASETEGQLKKFLVTRSGETPLTFTGIRIAQASRAKSTLTHSRTLSAAVYKTRDGKFVSSLSKTSKSWIRKKLLPSKKNATPDSEEHTAAIHDTLEEALQWFKLDWFTRKVRRQLLR